MLTGTCFCARPIYVVPLCMSTVLSCRFLLMCMLHTCTPLILYVHAVLHHCIFSWVDLHVDFTIHECCWVAPLFCTHLCMLDLLCCICWSATFVSLFWAEVFALPFLFLFLPCLLTLKQKKQKKKQQSNCTVLRLIRISRFWSANQYGYGVAVQVWNMMRKTHRKTETNRESIKQ